MVYFGVSDLLEQQAINVALVTNPMVKEVLVSELVTKLRSFVALNDDDAAVLREWLEPDGSTGLMTVYGAETNTDERGHLQVRLRVSRDAYMGGLPKERRSQEALDAFNVVVHGINAPVEGISCAFDSNADPPIAISLDEAKSMIAQLRERADNLERQVTGFVPMGRLPLPEANPGARIIGSEPRQIQPPDSDDTGGDR